MTQAIAYHGRLPGLRCEPALPSRGDDGIRLDVAAFVGFAERGPVDDPQLVEDLSQYSAVFGGDLQLAFDDKGVPVYAALTEAVRAFFDNGGRRAFVVRVAGASALTLDVPVRVRSRVPLGWGTAVVGLAATSTPDPDGGNAPLFTMSAASPGGWAGRLNVDVDVLDTVLALSTGDGGVVDLTSASTRALDQGDALLLRRGATWQLLWVTVAASANAPEGGWQEGDVVRLLRADVTVSVNDGGVATAVERYSGLRLGPGLGRVPSWTDVFQPAGGGYHRDRSQYLRGPDASTLIPLLGSIDEPVPPPAIAAVAAAGSRTALESDGLTSFEPEELFLDPALRGHTVEGLGLALDLLGLDDAPHAHGVHAVALEPEVAIVAIPDLYHRPWIEQAVLVDEAPPAAAPGPAPEPVGFHPCVAAPPQTPPAVPPTPPAVLRMVIEPASDVDFSGLHAVAAATVDLCAARGDMVAVLCLPRHAGPVEARDLGDLLANRRAASVDVASFAGVWHPWGAVAERRSPALAPLRPVPPDGAAAGTIAATELARGWWVEPAGMPFSGWLAADLFDAATEVELFDDGLNVVRRRPSGFVATSAHTQSPDRDLLQLSVRRLLIWVRKLAAREGSRFVFEPDDDRFRAQVASTFRRFLEQLRIAGALVAYQVDVEPLAARTLADEGRVRVALKLAPSSPIEFITVTLMRSGDGVVRIGGV